MKWTLTLIVYSCVCICEWLSGNLCGWVADSDQRGTWFESHSLPTQNLSHTVCVFMNHEAKWAELYEKLYVSLNLISAPVKFVLGLRAPTCFSSISAPRSEIMS